MLQRRLARGGQGRCLPQPLGGALARRAQHLLRLGGQRGRLVAAVGVLARFRRAGRGPRAQLVAQSFRVGLDGGGAAARVPRPFEVITSAAPCCRRSRTVRRTFVPASCTFSPSCAVPRSVLLTMSARSWSAG